MTTLNQKCPHCNRNVVMTVDNTISNIYCPFCKGSIQINVSSNQLSDNEKQQKEMEERNGLNMQQQQQRLKKARRKSNISEWWQPICFISGFFTILKNGPTFNLIFWPILFSYIDYNAANTGIRYDTDTYIEVGGFIIWIINIWLVLTI